MGPAAGSNESPLSPESSYEAVHGGVPGPGPLGPVLDAAPALAVLGLQEQHVHPGGGIPGTAPAAAPAPGPGGRPPACGFGGEEEEFLHLREGLPTRRGLWGCQHVLSALGNEQCVPAPLTRLPGHLFGVRRAGPVQLAGAPEGTSAGQDGGLPAGGGGLGGQHALPEPRHQLSVPARSALRGAAFF